MNDLFTVLYNEFESSYHIQFSSSPVIFFLYTLPVEWT